MKLFIKILFTTLLMVLMAPVVSVADGNETGASTGTAPSEALSEQDRARALIHFQKGEVRFSQTEYLLAVEHFKLSYDITKSPEILYNIAMCYEKLQENEQAVAYYNDYLQLHDAEDADEVKAKIVALGGTIELLPEEDEGDEEADDSDVEASETAGSDTEKKKKEKKRLDHFAFELGMGPAWVLMRPDPNVTAGGTDDIAKVKYFSIDLLGHFFLNDWFAITGVILLGPYMGVEDRQMGTGTSRDPKSHLGLGIGVGMKKKVQKRASLFTNLTVSYCTIKRESLTKRASWLAFDVRFGINIHVSEKFALNLMAVAEGGPAFVINPSGDEWDNGMLLSVGPRFGFTYSAL